MLVRISLVIVATVNCEAIVELIGSEGRDRRVTTASDHLTQSFMLPIPGTA